MEGPVPASHSPSHRGRSCVPGIRERSRFPLTRALASGTPKVGPLLQDSITPSILGLQIGSIIASKYELEYLLVRRGRARPVWPVSDCQKPRLKRRDFGMSVGSLLGDSNTAVGSRISEDPIQGSNRPEWATKSSATLPMTW